MNSREKSSLVSPKGKGKDCHFEMHYSLLLLTRPNLRRIFLLFLAVPCSLWGLSSPTRDWTRGHNSESAKSQPLDRQETSRINYFIPVEPAGMLSNCDAAEDSWESLGLQGDQTSQPQRKSTVNSLWKDWCWSSKTLVTWCEEPTHWKRPWCWERLKATGEAVGKGWDGWMATSTQWT